MITGIAGLNPDRRDANIQKSTNFGISKHRSLSCNSRKTCLCANQLYVAIPQGSLIQHTHHKCMVLQPAQTFSFSGISYRGSATSIHPVVQVTNFNTFLSLPSHQILLIPPPKISLESIHFSPDMNEMSSTVGTTQGQDPSCAVRAENYCSPRFSYRKQVHNLYQSG